MHFLGHVNLAFYSLCTSELHSYLTDSLEKLSSDYDAIFAWILVLSNHIHYTKSQVSFGSGQSNVSAILHSQSLQTSIVNVLGHDVWACRILGGIKYNTIRY